jgi:YidC/Oxa1 family membrane protein insertase
MDRTSIIGFILIAIVLMVWIWLNSPPPQQNAPHQDSVSHRPAAVDTASQPGKPVISQDGKSAEDSLGKYFTQVSRRPERILTIDADHFRAQLSTRGGCIKSWELKEFKTWDGHQVNLVNRNKGGDFNLLFYTSDGKLINTKAVDFEIAGNTPEVISFSAGDSVRLDYTINVSEKGRIVKSYIFFKESYTFDVVYRFERMESVISNFEYQVVWESGLNYQERNSVDESNSAMAYSYSGGELTELDAASFDDPPVKQNLPGRVKWVAMRNKYFGLAIIPRGEESQGAYLEGMRLRMPNNGAQEYYSIGLKMPFLATQEESARFTVFMGPLNFDLVKSLGVGLDHIMNLGYAWIIRPISEYVMIPLFEFLHLFIPNYGFVIIVFSFIIKIGLHPLTKSSMVSMRKMQSLQPMMEEIREKYKDDPQKMNQQVMRLYKEYGVNPAGGCLPMLLQMPILYALWAVFRSTLELRQAAFVGWVKDLSVPDVITSLPFPIPFFNITEISGLAVLMGITMFVQQKMSMKDPKQKMMVWMMPIFMTLLFNSFPSGLNLYYFVFNLLSIAQQSWINKQHKDEPPRKVEPKISPGLFDRLTKNMPKLK